MKYRNLLIISNNFPDKKDEYVGAIFVKEQVKFLTNFFDNVYVISPVAYGVELLRKTQHEDYSINKMHVYFPKYFNFPLFFFYFRDVWLRLEFFAISNFIRKTDLKFDLIHAHFTWPSGAVAAYLKKEFKVPLVITEHTSNTFRRAIEKKDPLFIRAWAESDIIIRVRRDDIPLFSDVGISLDKICYLPNGYDSSSFSTLDLEQSRKKLGLPLDKKILLNVGNLYSEVKGHRYLIEAIGKVVKKRTDVLCVIVGSGKLRNKLEAQIKEAGLEDYVQLVGGKPHTEIPLWINSCDLFVLPSLNEGNPTVLFECLGSGKPFVGTSVGGIPEIIVSDDYGLLVEPKNSNKLAKVILFALDRKWNRDKIIDYSIQFSWEKIATKIVSIYNTV
ncbi:MAG: glycosyltransferase family 4 protein [Methanosarcina sp.]|nr:glycosyltransferase family 4 protein [Methanosarcina sp.]